jgi:hypothetical protein
MAGRCNSCGNPTVDELIEAILARMICEREGLDVDEARRCLRVILSPGGGLEFDEFGRLRSNCCDGGEPQPAACVSTVEQMGDFVVGGRFGGAGLLHPYGSPQGLAYGLAHGLDMIVNDVWGAADEVAVWSVYAPQLGLDVYSTSPTTAAGAGVTSSDWLGLTIDAGTTANPTGRNAYAPPQHTDPDGGWYGWYAPQYNPMLFEQVLRQVSQRTVTWADVLTMPDDPEFDERSVVSAIRAVSGACTHASTILAVHPSMLDMVPAITNAQITAAVHVPGNVTVDPAAIAAAGATWVRISPSSAAETQAYIDAGLNVVVRTTGRHHETQRALDLGVRGIHSADPVFSRYPVDPSLFGYYRRATISYVRRQTETGHLTTETDDLGVIDARGFTKSTEFGLYLWVTDERLRNSVLIGGAMPLMTDPANGSYTWECQVDEPGGPLPDGTAPKIGVTVCSDTDVDTAPAEGDGSGYAVFIRVGTGDTGELEIGRLTPGQPYVMLAQSTTTQAVTPNEWMSFRLEVTPTTLTLTRTDGTPYSVTATDSTYRGPYVHWLANKSGGDGDFTAGVRQFSDANAALPEALVPESAQPRLLREALGPDAVI